MISNSEGNILDYTKLIDTLGVSKVTSEEIMVAVAEAEVAEKEIDTTREKYIPVAVRGSTLFFAISDLSLVDAMYQYSLTWFKALFLLGIQNAEASDDLEQRLVNLNDKISYSLYVNVCRSIFEEHKLMFSFLLCIKILMTAGKVDMGQWRFLLSGGALASGLAKPTAEWLEDKVWIEFINLATLPQFKGIDEHVSANIDAWRAVYDSLEPQNAPLPEPWNSSLDSLAKMCVLRCIRPDKCVPAVQSFVEENLGRRFIEPPPFDLDAAYQDASVTMPLIFVLSAGADPVKGLLQYAEQAGMDNKLDFISLGQGQGPKAEKLITTGKEQGRWVLLMNCHLFVSWMATLEKEVEDIDPNKTDPSFRLWLTSMPSKKFPVSVLQNGIKMTNEPPKGLRANLRTAIAAMPPERFEQTNKPGDWRKIMFGLLLFNAVILERRKFGPLGWNIPYQFTDGDCEVSLQQAKLLVNDYDVIPFKVIHSLTSENNYGGRVTDNWDRRTMSNLLHEFCNDNVLNTGYAFSSSGKYKSSDAETQTDYAEVVRNLPTNASPEVFGLHENADITCAQNDTAVLFATILSLQPRSTAGGGKSRDEILADLANDILSRMPQPYNLEQVSDTYPTKYEDSMNTVVQQECIRYNKVISKVLSSLKDLIKAISGEVVMTAELEEVGNSLFTNSVPEMWAKVAYPSLKPLATWVPDLIARLAFIQTWIDEGKPQSFWISGFYFPQAFITGTLQNHARKYQLPIDTISFGYAVRPEATPAELVDIPTDGALIYGLFIEGARWDMKDALLRESRAKELYTSMPLIHLLPTQHRVMPTSGIYVVPVYKTLARFGTLSTTGHSTNFVMTLEIPTDQEERHWIKRGVACVTALKV